MYLKQPKTAAVCLVCLPKREKNSLSDSYLQETEERHKLKGTKPDLPQTVVSSEPILCSVFLYCSVSAQRWEVQVTEAQKMKLSSASRGIGRARQPECSAGH